MRNKRKASHFYVYAVVNFEQRLAYIGSRGSVMAPLEDSYMGSYDKSSKFKPEKKIVLSEHKTRAEAYEAEREWQLKFNVADSTLFVNKGIHTSSGFSMYGRKLSDEHKAKLSIKFKNRVLSEEQKRKISASRKGMKFTEQHKKKLSEVNKGKKLSEYAKAQLRLANTGRKMSDKCKEKFERHNKNQAKPVSIKNAFTGELYFFETTAAASRFIGCNRSSIIQLRQQKTNSVKGYIEYHGLDDETEKIRIKQAKENTGRFDPKKIKIFDNVCKKVLTFKSHCEAAKQLKICEQSVNALAKKSIKKIKNGRYVLA